MQLSEFLSNPLVVPVPAYGIVLLTCMMVAWIAVIQKEPPKSSRKSEIKSIRLEKNLCLKDQIVIDMICHTEHENLSFILTDPDKKDNVIVYSSTGFSKLTGYAHEEIVGKNCRFLQGKDTKHEDVRAIRKAIRDFQDTSICILNYTKDGTPFVNQFFICPLFSKEKKLAYFLGIQVKVESYEKGQQEANPGWIYRMGLHR